MEHEERQKGKNTYLLFFFSYISENTSTNKLRSISTIPFSNRREQLSSKDQQNVKSSPEDFASYNFKSFIMSIKSLRTYF